MPTMRYRSIDEIKETLENAKSRGRGCVLLIGAGCSVKAGIPTAAGFVDIIQSRYQHAHQRAAEKTYAKCMGELLLSERRDLIGQYIDKAQINWAHLCIALLMQAGYVDRVLTTNFDSLVVRACAMLGVFPAIYDFATSQLLKKADIPGQAVFYLHGQRTGFVLMNTERDMEKHSKLLRPVFDDAGSGRVWIVAGYSGENDPVFKQLARVPFFDNGLFWVGYGDREPAAHVRERLLTQDKDAFYTKGYDADSFFVGLTRALGIFPPDLVARPFSYLQQAMTYITPFADLGQVFEEDVMEMPRSWIHDAIHQFETPAWELISRQTPGMDVQPDPKMLAVAARYLLMQGQVEQVIGFHNEYGDSPPEELADVLSMAYVIRGNQFLDRAKASTVDKSEALFGQARQDYETALQLQPKRHEALHNWGNLLLDQAKTKTGEEADRLFSEAEEKYRQSLRIKPERPDVLVNWGNLLLDRAKTRTGEEADRLFTEAELQYQAALKLKPDLYQAFYQWGNVYLDRAKTRAGQEADDLFDQAVGKYQVALQSNPNMYQAFNNWGHVFLERAKRQPAEAADPLFLEAQRKYQAALEIKPDDPTTLNNLGNILSDRARRKSGQEADELFAEAEKNYKAALAFQPDMPDALDNWGNLLWDWAKTRTGEKADSLFAEAEKKYSAVLKLRPGTPDILQKWGMLLLDWERTKTGEEAARLHGRAEEMFQAAHAAHPPGTMERPG